MKLFTLTKRFLFTIALSVPAYLSFGQLSFTDLNTNVGEDLMSVHFTDADHGYACGADGRIIKTEDAGTTWTISTSGTSERLWDIKSIPGTNKKGLIAVGEKGVIVMSSDGGATWQVKNSPLTNGYIFSIQCVSKDSLYACGADFTTLSGVVLLSRDGGDTWLKSYTGKILDKIMFVTPAIGFAAGAGNDFLDGGVWKTTDGGGIWTIAENGTKNFTSLWCVDKDHIVAVGVAGQVSVSNDGGDTWTKPGVPMKDYYDVYFKDNKTGFISGGDSTGSVILQTTDGGNTWTQVSYPGMVALKGMGHGGEHLYIAGDKGHMATGQVGLDIKKQHIAEKAITVFPSPAGEFVSIRSGATTMHTFRIILVNNLGIVVKEAIVDAPVKDLDVSTLPNGVYYYKEANDSFLPGKILIQR